MTPDDHTDNDKVYSDEERYSDSVSVTTTSHQGAYLDTEMLRGRIDGWEDEDTEFGISVVQDGEYLGLRTGTTAQHRERTEQPNLFIACGLTPDMAREIADGLYEAASEVEELEEESDQETDPESFLRRLLP